MASAKPKTAKSLNDTKVAKVLANPPYTIINRNRDVNVLRAEYERGLAQGLKRNSPKIADLFERLPLPMREAVLSNTSPSAPFKWVRSPRRAIPTQSALVSQFSASVKALGARAQATTIGILDLGARVADLSKLIEKMNKAQDRMVFFEVQTPVPAGMVKTGPALVTELERVIKHPLEDENRRAEVSSNMLVNEFLIFAESVRQKNGLDSLIGITPALLTYYRDEEVRLNYFSFNNQGPLSMVSTFQLRDYAKRASRPFEAAVGMLIVGRLMADRNHLIFHEDGRSCPLDKNRDHEGLVDSIRKMQFDSECLKAIKDGDPDEARAATALMASLRQLRGVKS
jgi:hypothetical protein